MPALVGLGIGALDDVGAREALQLLHAPHDARFQIHDAVGVLEIAGQLREGALDLARTFAEIALLERGLVGSALLAPERFAAIGVEQARIGPLILREHLPVFLDLAFRRILRAHGRGRQQGQRDCECNNAQT